MASLKFTLQGETLEQRKDLFMNGEKYRVRQVFWMIQLILLLAATTAAASPRSQWRSYFRGRAYTQFAIGPALAFYTLHRELKEDVSYVDNNKKWWRFIGGARNYDLQIGYVFRNGFTIGGYVAVVRSSGMSNLSDSRDRDIPGNPVGTFSIMTGPVVGFYPRGDLGWYVQAYHALGYSTFSTDAPTGSFRAITGYEWAAGPSGAIGLNVALEVQWTKSEEEGRNSDIVYDSFHLPLIAMLNVCMKGFWD